MIIRDQINRDYSSNFSSRIAQKHSPIRLSAQEMLSISEEISREYAAYSLQQPSRSEIVLLPVDPGHLHAYWHIDENQVKLNKTEPLTLRIYSMPDNHTADDQARPSFDLAVEPAQTQHKVAVPETITGNYYTAEIGRRQTDNHFAVFASSEMTYIPRMNIGWPKSPALPFAEPRFLTQNASARGKYA